MRELRTLPVADQVRTLVDRGLLADDDPLALALLEAGADPTDGLVVLAREVAPVADAAAHVERDGHGVVLGHLEPQELAGFVPIAGAEPPPGPAHLVLDVDLGDASRNVRPEDALRDIRAAGRSPLTIDEGIALVLQQPAVIAQNWGFSMAGSRRGDQRVPAFWISERRPKLGWCWDRNPHTWLGTASCAGRRALIGDSVPTA